MMLLISEVFKYGFKDYLQEMRVLRIKPKSALRHDELKNFVEQNLRTTIRRISSELNTFRSTVSSHLKTKL